MHPLEKQADLLDQVFLPSSGSTCSWSCPSVGYYGWSKRVCPCGYGEMCEAITDASKAPLCLLPQYMASRFKVVRRAARARFIEVQE